MPLLPVTRAKGKTRTKRARAVQPSSADVPTVSPRVSRDPGLRVPSIEPLVQASKGTFDSQLGIAAEEISPALNELEQTATKIQNREDTVARISAKRNYRDEVEAELLRINNEEDLSDTNILRGLGSFTSKRKEEILNNHTGSADSQVRLLEDLDTIESEVIGKASGISVNIGKKKIDDELKVGLGALGDSAAQDPSKENIDRLFLEADALVDDMSGGLEIDEEIINKRIGREQVSLSALDSLIISGRVEQADALFGDLGIVNSLTPEKQREVRRRIQTVFASRKDILFEAQKAKAIEGAKLEARRENINLILADAGAPQVIGSGELATTTPFGEDATASADVQDAMRLFSASRRLILAGENGMANGLLSQARFIIENSPEIQREKELDKPISAELASEFGVPVGTTLRSVMSIIPRSPEEQAESRAVASARGKERIKGEEQISFIDEAETMVVDLLEEIETDPTIVGIGGSLRATGQTGLGVLSDLGGSKLADSARSIAFDNTDLGLDDVAKLFDSPTLSVLSIMENSIGLILARLRTPSGRIPVDVIKRSIDDVSLTGLKGSKQVQNRLNFVLQQLRRRSGAIEKRFDLPEKTQIGIPRFKVEGGKLVPIQGAE